MVGHYAGMAVDMDKILEIARKFNLAVIEDAAHALGAKYKGKALGTIGTIGCFSFHGTKNVASGEGGFFATNEKEISQMAEIIREKGTNRSSFIRGERKKYSWIRVGRSLVLSDILSAIALEQVKKLDEITAFRKKKAQYFLKKNSQFAIHPWGALSPEFFLKRFLMHRVNYVMQLKCVDNFLIVIVWVVHHTIINRPLPQKKHAEQDHGFHNHDNAIHFHCVLPWKWMIVPQ